MAVRDDNSADKSVTVREHRNGKCYSAPIGSFSDKIHGMRVQVHEPKTDKIYYFIFPYASYRHMSDTTTIEILFKKDGTPAKQRKDVSKSGIPNWWKYQVKSGVKMCTTVIHNDSAVPAISHFNRLFEEQED